MSAQFAGKAKRLNGDQRCHGNHGYYTESIGQDISSGCLTGSHGKRQKEGGSHGAAGHTAGVEGDRRKYLWTKKDRQTAMTYPCTMNQKIEIPDSTQKMESSTETPAGAVTFSLLVTGTAGLWMLEDE